MTEEIIPNAIRTWTIFKNTNNILEGIEAITFAIRQVALDEIEKESDNVVFMSDATVKTIIGTLKRLEQENAKLKEKLEEARKQVIRYRSYYCKGCYEIAEENEKLKEKYQEELTVNTQLREWGDEDLRQIAELKKDLDLFRKAHDTEQAQRRILEQKLEKIKELCQVPNEPYYNSECEFGKGRIDLGQEILEIIEGAEDE